MAGGKAKPTDPTTVADPHAAVGIDPDKLSQTPIGRTVKYADGGVPVTGLLGS